MANLYLAGDERFGAFGVSSSALQYVPRATSPLPELADAQHLSEVASTIEAAEPLMVLGAKIVTKGGSPMGGTKPKGLLALVGRGGCLSF